MSQAQAVALTTRDGARLAAHHFASADWGVARIGHFGLICKERAGHWPRIAQMQDQLPAMGAQRNAR